ncbi:MAG: antibiotic biosynthesis monooxygenase, partial [Acidobacteriota bacterium]
MFIVQVYAQVKPEHVDAFREASVENARESLKEPGVARFDLVQEV